MGTWLDDDSDMYNGSRPGFYTSSGSDLGPASVAVGLSIIVVGVTLFIGLDVVVSSFVKLLGG